MYHQCLPAVAPTATVKEDMREQLLQRAALVDGLLGEEPALLLRVDRERVLRREVVDRLVVLDRVQEVGDVHPHGLERLERDIPQLALYLSFSLAEGSKKGEGDASGGR